MIKASLFVATVIVVSFVVYTEAVTTSIKRGDSTYYLKQLAGPPSEFPDHALPTPANGAQIQQSSYNPMWADSKQAIKLANAPQSTLYQGPVYVDSTQEFQLSFMSPLTSVQITLVDPNNNNVDLSNGVADPFPIGEDSFPATTWSFLNPIVGVYTITLTSTSSMITRDSITSDESPIGIYTVLNLSPVIMIGQLSSYNMQQGQPVGLIASVLQDTNARSIAKANGIDSDEVSAIRLPQGSVLNAYMAVTLPDGSEEDLEMLDDGLHGDLESGDGIYGAQLTAIEVGTYQMQAVIQGTTSQGVAFLRTTQHLVASVPDGLALVGTASAVNIDSNTLNISIDVTYETQMMVLSESFTAYAEVYGINSNGEQAPACFISGITEVIGVGSNQESINLILNLDWLSYSGVQPPLTLKNVVVQEIESFVPVASYSSIPVTTDAFTNAIIRSQQKTITSISKEMSQGQIPEELLAKKKTDVAGAVILVHGYCSGTNPWSPYPNDWTNAYFFIDPQASRTHDAFSRLIISYGEAQGLGAYSLVGHSQGGIVAAHILNYYFSGMDLITSGKPAQSIGTPYEGCSVAGGWANLGSSFGIGCGDNFDLSLDGSKLWLPSITTATRQQLYYYTTTYKQGNLFGDSCSAAINLILEWPNDGVAELEYTDLRSANNMGNTQQQCHTTDMNYVAQYYDHTRNKVMNTQAGR